MWSAAAAGGEAFPVGSVFLAVVSTDPATLLGYGTWSAFAAGRMLVGYDSGDTDFDTAKETDGAKTVTLSSTEMPSHTHVQNAHNHTQDPHQHGMSEGTTDGSGDFVDRSNVASTSGIATDRATATNQATTATNQNTGGDSAQQSMPPHIVVYMWNRTA